MPQIDVTLVSERVLVLFLTMFAGVAARKLGYIDDAMSKKLSKLLVNITQPLMIVTSFQIAYDAQRLQYGVKILAASAVIHVFASVFGFFMFKQLKNPSERVIYEFAVIFSNCAFIGYPVLSAVFGETGIFYGAFYTIFFNIYIWTYGIALLRRGKTGVKIPLWKVFINAGTVSSAIGIVLFVAGFRIPSPIYSAAKLVGDMTFPLSMMIVGSLISNIKLLEVITSLRMLFFLLVRCFLLPCAVLAVCWLVRLDRTLAYVCVIMSAMPSAANTAIFSELYGADSKLGSEVVGMSTLLSVASVPCMLFLMNFLIK